MRTIRRGPGRFPRYMHDVVGQCPDGLGSLGMVESVGWMDQAGPDGPD